MPVFQGRKYTERQGIDYSFGRSNRVGEMHFGVISMNALDGWAWERVESDYGDPTCPQCGSTVDDYATVVEDDDETPSSEYEEHRESSCADYACNNCKLILGSDEVYGDEPKGHKLDEDGYEGFVGTDNDLMLTKSPYYTHAQYCSPCAPGACHLENPLASLEQVRFPKSKKKRIRKKWEKREENYRLVPFGPKCFCLGHDWFEGDKAPYPVFDVETGKEVPPGSAE